MVQWRLIVAHEAEDVYYPKNCFDDEVASLRVGLLPRLCLNGRRSDSVAEKTYAKGVTEEITRMT